MKRLPLALGALLSLAPSSAQAFCTGSWNSWADSCDESDGPAICTGLWAAELATPTIAMHAIPVYLNFDTTPFLVDHPNFPGDPTQQIQIHRSLERTGLSRAVMTEQVKASIAQWNQSAAGHPMLYLAGDAYGDTALQENRPVGIVIDSDLCFGRNQGRTAAGGSNQPAWMGDEYAYRGRITIIPYLHSVVGETPGRCTSLPDEYNPRPIIPCDGDPMCVPTVDTGAPGIGFDEDVRTSRIDDGFQSVLIHELGHTFGLNHNFFGVSNSPSSCGLGVFGSDTWGVMSYYTPDLTHIRRDDTEAVRALFTDYLPATWRMQAWRRPATLPNSDIQKEGTLFGLATTVPPVVANQIIAADSRIAVAFADSASQVRVRTALNGAIEPVVGAQDIPLAGQNGKTFTPPTLAIGSNPGMPSKVLVMWNEERANRLGIETRWAIRNLIGGAWANFGPNPLIIQDIPSTGATSRFHATLGATYDPVFNDFVVSGVSATYRPGLTVINQAGAITFGPFRLSTPVTSPLRDYNAVGAPVCIRRPANTSLCMIPIATSGDSSRIGVLTVRRTGAAVFSTRVEYLSNVVGYGNVTLAFNDTTQEGHLGYTDDRGDVRWLRVTVNAANVPSFAPHVFPMDGNGRYTPAILTGQPRNIANDLQRVWPTCPYWPAFAGAFSGITPSSPTSATVVRGLCVGVCGDGFIDPPPFGDEQCDGDELGGETCESLGFDGGTLECTRKCTFDDRGCFNNPDPPEDPEPEAGDCLEVINSCADITGDGCYPDGPGSYGKGGSGTGGFGGLYCPDNGDLPQVCGFSLVDEKLTPTCLECPEPGEGNGDVPYGCACASDNDCEGQALASTSGAPNGTLVSLSCFGSADQGWMSGNGRCLPAIDPASPQTQTIENAALEEFERTRWLCKSNCEALTDAAGVQYICHYTQNGLDLDYAACVDEAGCPGPTGQCEESGGACDQNTNTCELECNPNLNSSPGNPDCLGRGYPNFYQCAHGWAAEGMCVPPECSDDPLGNSLDLSACQMFLNANVF
jgi:hypothetical protein